MNFIEFKNRLSLYPVFSLQDIIRIDPTFHKIQLSRWEKKKYIEKVGRKWYVFLPIIQNDILRFTLSNTFISPSYISLQSALSYYNFIPEAVMQTTAVSSKKTYRYETNKGIFSYKKIHAKNFWGYELKNNIKIASPEKAILDFLYLYPQYSSIDDFHGLRLNIFEIDSIIEKEKFIHYAKLFENKALLKRCYSFLQFLCSH